MTLREGDRLWKPSADFVENCNYAEFKSWLKTDRGLDFATYEEMRQWSVDDVEAFWLSIWDYYDIESGTPHRSVLSSREMPGAKWFDGSTVNFAEHVLRHEAEAPDSVIFYHCSEKSGPKAISRKDLGDQVRTLATALRNLGLQSGDRVVSFMPNVPATMIAMLAVAAIGGIWSSAAPEFGQNAVIDRFQQIEPKLMFAADGYQFGGKTFERHSEIEAILEGVPSIETLVWFDNIGSESKPQFENLSVINWQTLLSGAAPDPKSFEFTKVDCDHPLWILFSSGTTGLPKAIVHSHVGILLEYYKSSGLHLDMGPSDVMFFYTTAGWMMWNALLQAPLLGGAAVLYDGNPSYPGPDTLWKIAAETGATLFGASPTYVELMRKNHIVPKDRFDMSKLKKVLLAGSPSTPETFKWFYDSVTPDLWMTSQSGGTEFCGGVVVSVPTLPVHAGEIQARALGADVHVFDDAGEQLIDQVGELVITKPLPSMPIFLWGDENYERYKNTYFDVYPGVWRHGDFMKINQRGGCYIYGRSDSTLNRYGVRFGSSEIYRTIEAIDDVIDSMVVCIESGTNFYMPLFVKMREGLHLSDDTVKEISQTLKRERSPRHVPDEIIEVSDIPYTLSGKKMEVPVRKMLLGFEPSDCFNREAMRNPESMSWFVDFSKTRISTQ